MSSSRFNNDRFNPRDRSPPPGRFGDRRPSGAYNNNAGYPPRPNDFARSYSDNRDIPRGPRGLSDTPTRPAPTGPRARGGFATRNDFRDNRDAPSFSTDRWRDGEERWERRTSPRARSPPRGRTPPPRDRRDEREFPKPIDTERARIEARDGPPSAGSNLSDPPRNTGPAYRGGGFARGRGDFRRYPTDDRTSFRQRSRSRGPRRERDRSVDSRDMDVRDRARDTDERRFYRDREDVGYFRRGDATSRLDARPSDGRIGGTSTQSTPQSERPPTLHVSPQDGPAVDSRRPYDGSRRGSALSDGFPNKPPRDERPDLFAGRISRAASPPPSAPQVPAFGFRQPTFAGPTSISWKNPDLQKPPPASGAAQTFKGPPTAPRALQAIPPTAPTAPKADRVPDRSKIPSKDSLNGPAEDATKDVAQIARPPLAQPVAQKPTLEVQQPVSAISSQTNDLPPSSASKLLAPPSGPRAMSSNSQPFGRSPPIGGFARAVSPNPSNVIPTGPRAAGLPTSPRMLPDNVPTGPKADRMVPLPPRGPPQPKLFRANSQASIRSSIVPSKRDSDGQEREISPTLSSRQMGNFGPAVISHRFNSEDAKEEGTPYKSQVAEPANKSPKTSSTDTPSHVKAPIPEDVEMADAPTESTAQDAQALGNLSDDDDDLDMSELLAEHEEKFISGKARLEARKIDLSGEEFRPSLLLDHVVRLVALQSVVTELEFKPRVEKKTLAEETTNCSINTPAELPTPREDQDALMVDDFAQFNRSSRESSCDQFSSPDPESLPYLEQGPPTPLSDPDPFASSRHHVFADQMKALIKREYNDEADEQDDLETQYRELYKDWKQYISELDKVREEDENALKQSSPEALSTPIAPEMPLAPLPTPTEGGRRAHRFATEYEMERVIELSRREDEEKRQREREAKEAQASASRDREARIPDMLSPAEIARRTFEDNSQARQPRDAIRIFDFVPPPDDFTEEEDRALRAEYAMNIKAWGRIAVAVGNGRTYKECINHYYATKWDRPYEKKQRGRRGKRVKKLGPPGKKSALVPAGDAEVVDADGSAPFVTESGRPRRAAAPQWPKDPDAEQGLLMPPGKKAGAGGKYDGSKEGEPGTDKPGRRKGTKEKVSRKARNQPLAARPTASSPQKTDKEGKEKIVPMASEDRTGWETMPQLLPNQQLYQDIGAADIIKVGASVPIERARSHSQSQRQGASSYWSVVEEHDFRKCLEYYGTDFQAIATHMGSKTQTMIKNHFHKLVADGKNLDLVQKANEATTRRTRGEAIGPPPIPTQPSKRRYDPNTTPMPRTLAPNNEAIEMENSPSQPAMPLHASPPQFPPQNRFPAQQPPAPRQPNSAAEPRPHQDQIIAAQNQAPRPHHPAGPRMGFFDDARQAVPHTFQPPTQQASQQQPLRPGSNQNENQTQRIAPIKTEHDNNPSRGLFTHPPVTTIAEQDGDRERDQRVERDILHPTQRALQDTRARKQAEEDARAQLDIEQHRQRQPQPNPYQLPRGQLPQSMYPHPSGPDGVRPEQRFSQTHFGMQVTPTSSVSSPVVDLTGPPAQQPPSHFSPQLRAARPLSPARGPPVSNTMPQKTMASTPTPAPAVKESLKRVNIMSMLNPEPEEERPRRREPELGTPVLSGTPTQQYRAPQLPPSEASTPRDAFGEPRSFSRATFAPSQATPGSSVSTPTSESAPREGLPSMGGHRDSWPGSRPSFQVPPMQQGRQVGSPLSQAQHGPSMPEPRGSLFGSRDYRPAAFSSLNQSARHVPSPPPAAAGPYSHSRTPSFTHGAQSQYPTTSSSITTSSGPALNLRTNPYAQKDLPSVPTPQPHLHGSQVVPVQTRNEANHNHNQYAQFQDPRQDPRREAMFDRFRERPSDPTGREREQRDREQQHHRDQMMAQQPRYGGHHTPPVMQPQFAPPDRSGPTPMSHQAYAPPREAGLQHPDSRHQQQLEYQQELLRREYERERQRRERMEQEARYRQDVQAQRNREENLRAQQLGQGWEPPQPPNL